MAIDYAFEQREGYLVAKVIGTFDTQEGIQTFPRILDACLEHHVFRVLIDLRQMSVRLPFATMDVYEYGAAASQMVVDYASKGLAQFRMAFFGTPAQMDTGHFGETVFRNRGVNVKGTADEAEAVAFLTEDLA